MRAKDVITIVAITLIGTCQDVRGNALMDYAGCFEDNFKDRVMEFGPDTRSTMTLEMCVKICRDKKFDYAGLQWHAECYCGIGKHARLGIKPDGDCSSACRGNPQQICGGGGRLSVYKVCYAKDVKNCIVKPWGTWAACDVTCGAGQRTRVRYITQKPVCGGVACPAVNESMPCQKPICTTTPPITAGVLHYMGCYNDGGPGKRVLPIEQGSTTDRTVEQCAKLCRKGKQHYAGLQYYTECYCGGETYNSLGRLEDHDCETPCKGNPSQACGGGGKLSVYKVCYAGELKDCIVTEWSAWGQCNATCGEGAITRTRKITQKYFCGGIKCPLDLLETKPCSLPRCTTEPPLTLGPLEYQGCYKDEIPTARIMPEGPFKSLDMTIEKCSLRCKGMKFEYSGLQWKEECYCGNSGYDVQGLREDDECGTQCRGNPAQRCGGGQRMSVYMICYDGDLVNCSVTEWSAWGPCVPSCGPAESVRFRNVTTKPLCGGERCPLLLERRPCNQPICTTTPPPKEGDIHHMGCFLDDYKDRVMPVGPQHSSKMSTHFCHLYCRRKGVYQYFGLQYHSECYCSNGGYDRIGERPSKECSAVCTGNKYELCGGGGRLSVFKICYPGDLIDCEYSEWGPWGKCDAKCGQGNATRTRNITREMFCKGIPCPPTEENRTCTVGTCATTAQTSPLVTTEAETTTVATTAATTSAAPTTTTTTPPTTTIPTTTAKTTSKPTKAQTTTMSKTTTAAFSSSKSSTTEAASVSPTNAPISTPDYSSAADRTSTNAHVTSASATGGTGSTKLVTSPRSTTWAMTSPNTGPSVTHDGRFSGFSQSSTFNPDYWTTTVPDIGPPKEYLGCVKTAFPGVEPVKSGEMTPGYCAQYCASKYANVTPMYVGVQGPDACYCTRESSFDKQETLPDANCSQPCEGEPSRMCGGDGTSRVYKVCYVIVDCEMTDWSQWGGCVGVCGSGQQSRMRTVRVEPCAGARCRAASDRRTCGLANVCTTSSTPASPTPPSATTDGFAGGIGGGGGNNDGAAN